MATRDISICAGCEWEDRCDLQSEKSRLAFFAYPVLSVVSCSERRDRWWRGIEGVAA